MLAAEKLSKGAGGCAEIQSVTIPSSRKLTPTFQDLISEALR